MNIIINNKHYTCPTTWNEVTLAQATELWRAAESVSPMVKDYFASYFEPSANEPSFCVADSTELLAFMVDAMAILCRIPIDELHKTEPSQIEIFTLTNLTQFIVSSIFEPVYTPMNIENFEWRGETLLLPQSGIDIEGDMMALEGISAQQLCLASDLHIAGSIRYAPLIVALLCRPADEKFSTRKATQRAQTMKELPMSIVLEVFFCFRRLISI